MEASGSGPPRRRLSQRGRRAQGVDAHGHGGRPRVGAAGASAGSPRPGPREGGDESVEVAGEVRARPLGAAQVRGAAGAFAKSLSGAPGQVARGDRAPVTKQRWSAWALLGAAASVMACGGWID